MFTLWLNVKCLSAKNINKNNKYIIYSFIIVQWVIGYFKEEHKYSVIPNEWLVNTVLNGVTSYFCKWPPHRVTTMMLMKGGKTSEKWKKYPVRIIGTFGKS